MIQVRRGRLRLPLVTTSPWLGRLTAWIRPAGPAAGRIGSIALTRWFAAVGALAIGLFSLAMGWQVSSYLERRMLERDAALSRDFVQSIVNIQQVSGYLAVPGTATAPSVVEFFAHVVAMPDVLRANVYAPDRRLVWSSRQELIGQRFGANDELDEALRGRVVVHRADDDGRGTKDEHLGLAARRTPYVEDYLPVYDAQGRGPIGVVELYRQPVALYQAIQEGQWRIRLGALLGGLFLFAVLVWFVRHTERALQDRERRLVEAETLAVAGELSAAVAHSIRNPLGSIRSGAELQRELHGDQQGVHAETIQHVDRIEHLVRTLLAYAGDGQDRQARADLAEVLQSAAARFAPDLRANGRTLETRMGADLGQVGAAPVVMAQVLNSLLANALEATAPGDRVRLSACRDGRRALIELQDSGSGIAAERLDDVFKPFFTTKPRGLGLGLPLARRIVRRLGGELRIESSPGCGTRVAIELPVVDP